MQYPKSGYGFVPEYQMSGLPWVSQSSGYAVIDFPYVTQWLHIKSAGGPTTVAFTLNGLSGSNRFSLPASGTIGPVDLRIKKLFISGGVGATWEILAGLTTIEPNMAPPLSASYAEPALSSSFHYGIGYLTGLG